MIAILRIFANKGTFRSYFSIIFTAPRVTQLFSGKPVAHSSGVLSAIGRVVSKFFSIEIESSTFSNCGLGKDCSLNPLTMKVQYGSDFHLEFPENRKFLTRNPLKVVAEILVLAGDIVSFREMEKAREFFDFVSYHYSKVFWVPGNHEYYGSDITEKPVPLWEDVRYNVHLVNNQLVDYGGFRFIFSTLWSRISPLLGWDIQRSIADFSAISWAGGNFTSYRFGLLHRQSLKFLKNALQTAGGTQSIVVTHHVPTLMNYPSVYKNSPLTEAFAVELRDLIDVSGPNWWIYGHHHVNTPDFQIGRTRMLTNQLGYVHHHEHGSFRRDLVLKN
jgi:Icc-related predicted phosphoesterase